MQKYSWLSCLLLGFISSVSSTVQADVNTLDQVVVYGHETSLIGEAASASEGIIGQGEISQRPILRSGEILEFVPGMVVTQHSGSGKANQYFLRGFNLDHGTDFRTELDGMPVNMRTHGHGQGYTDLSFIVPEFISTIDYQKGPYHAEDGDFSTAGSARFSLLDQVQPFVQIGLGEDAYRRGVMATSLPFAAGHLLLGLEAHQYDGPWTDISEDVEKLNVLARYTSQLFGGKFSLSFMAYDNQWNAADQIPQRAVATGRIDRLGSIDPTAGGDASRYSVSSQWQAAGWNVSAYAVRSDLDLFSNFTYLLDDPFNGDQFEQVDQRWIYGGQVSREFQTTFADRTVYHRSGLTFRVDDINDVALHKTRQRQRISTVREDDVWESSAGFFWESELQITNRLRANIGLRYDYLYADVSSDLSANSGTANDALFSVKGGMTYWLTETIDLYLNAGQSFHSNDARGATIKVDPVSGDPIDPVDLLVRGEGAEVGFRYNLPEKLNLSMALWMIELDSELLFVGDAGNTEASRASRRWGVELAAYFWLNDVLSSDLELAWTRSRFTENAIGEGNEIEGSLPFVASAGLTWQPLPKWQGSLRLRYFGSRTLDSFGENKSDDFTVVNASVGYHDTDWRLSLELLNLLDSKDHDIDYFYASQLSGEANGVEDQHFHPIEPRTFRLQLSYYF